MRTAIREVAVLGFPDFQLLDVTGPVEVFSQATRRLEALGKGGGYVVRVGARKAGALESSSGLPIHATSLDELPRRPDTLLLSGGRGVREALEDVELLDWTRRTAAHARRVASVCTGAFLLARAGLLDGRAATTHWDSCALLAKTYPQVTVEPDRIFVKDGPVYTSAGVTAGIDLALELISEDHGPDLALDVARQLVVFLKRPGGQSQFSAQLALQASDREPIAVLRTWIEENLGKDLAVPALARRAGMSPRNFARRFVEDVGTTPARYVALVRLGAARRRLEDTSQDVARVARETGFGSAETLRRAFVESLGTTPSDYRRRFQSRAPRH